MPDNPATAGSRPSPGSAELGGVARLRNEPTAGRLHGLARSFACAHLLGNASGKPAHTRHYLAFFPPNVAGTCLALALSAV